MCDGALARASWEIELEDETSPQQQQQVVGFNAAAATTSLKQTEVTL